MRSWIFRLLLVFGVLVGGCDQKEERCGPTGGTYKLAQFMTFDSCSPSNSGTILPSWYASVYEYNGQIVIEVDGGGRVYKLDWNPEICRAEGDAAFDYSTDEYIEIHYETWVVYFTGEGFEGTRDIEAVVAGGELEESLLCYAYLDVTGEPL